MTSARDLLVYLAGAVVCVLLATRLRLGAILGYLVAGALIGPFALHLVSDEAAAKGVSEFGIVLMLFAIGLELDVRQLWGMRRSVFGGGALQVAACSLVLGGVLFGAGVPWQGALVAGIALALSSTAIAMRTLAERSLERTPTGRTAFAILLFQDIAAIPLLALVPALSLAPVVAGAEHAAGPAWLGPLKALGALAAVVVVGRYLTRPLLRPIAATGVREVFTAAALLLVLGVAELMHLAGLSMALGAFLAGVMLASSEYRHALESDLEPFKGLLLGLFFITVGMSIDFSLLLRRPLELAALVPGFVVVKVAVLRLLARPLGVDARQRWLFAALVSQGGEFAFVVFGLASDALLLPGDWGPMLTLTVALSMASTPLLLLVLERLELRRAGQQKKVYDAIEDEGAKILIAGFGRFGQIVGRLLFASGLKATVLDHDPEAIDALRRFGFRVFYGDVTRLDLLDKAGAARAQVLVIAIDDVEAGVALAASVQKEYPKLRILARARNVSHYAELRRLGVEVVERETFESALVLGRRALEALGCPPHEARERAVKFRRHNVRMLEDLLLEWDDMTRRVQRARAASDDLEQQFERDRQALEEHGVTGWHMQDAAAGRAAAPADDRPPTPPADVTGAPPSSA
ncbi:MAG: glutathione-regulated potassium-efflux system protein KefC, partial [Polyangiaceae bacterium]|nr:glutathione-regulated potassium-efflux system protein KefC [Polyangiaceae bacterium]